MPDETGLYSKYEVTKDGEPVTDCFVLRPDRDRAARRALEAYADVCGDLALRDDLRDWIDRLWLADREEQ